MIGDWQKQIVIGTVLGGSSLVKPPKGVNYYLSMRSTKELWLKYKMAELDSLFVNQTLYRCANTFRVNSVCSEELTDLHRYLYEGHSRRVSRTTLDSLRLRDIGITLWFLEGGGKTGRGKKNAYLNVTKFGPEGAEEIQEWFRLCDIGCSINRNKNRLRILFSVTGTEVLLKLVAHLVPEFMLDRL